MQTQTYRISRVLSPIAAALFITFSSHAVMAEKHDHDHEMEQHDSHEHGAARLAIATTDDGLEIMLESPAANVFGFEHKAKSEEEQEVVHEALAKLKDGSVLFAVNESAGCSLEGGDVEASGVGSHDEKKHDDYEKEETHENEHDHDKKEKHDDHKDEEHDHEKEKKYDDHEHEKKEKHDEHEHDAHSDEKGTHSDVEAVWAYHCDKPGSVETVMVKLFSAFPGGFKEIDVEWISAENAGKTELEKDGMVSLK